VLSSAIVSWPPIKLSVEFVLELPSYINERSQRGVEGVGLRNATVSEIAAFDVAAAAEAARRPEAIRAAKRQDSQANVKGVNAGPIRDALDAILLEMELL